MACNSCSSTETLVRGDDLGLITVSGSGSPSNPYIISTSFSFADLLQTEDGDTVNFSLNGAGLPGNPYVLSAEASIALTDLTDVEDPSGAPVAGESLVYTGTFPTGHWEYRTLPPAPAGAVNVNHGLVGVGSAAAPIGVATSHEWGFGPLAPAVTGTADSNAGLMTYIDVGGAVRAWPGGLAKPKWLDIQDKPDLFKPSLHKHPASDITAQDQLNAGRVNGVKVTYTQTTSTAPSNPTVGDLWIFPKGS